MNIHDHIKPTGKGSAPATFIEQWFCQGDRPTIWLVQYRAFHHPASMKVKAVAGQNLAKHLNGNDATTYHTVKFDWTAQLTSL